ncbi:MAG: VOC family protein [Pseudomonadota bacterium]
MDEFGEGEDEITVFSLGDVYLMVEHRGSACLPQKSEIQYPTKFRFNVPDVKAAGEKIARKGVQISVLTHVWGVTAEFFDPDGNRCALRSDAGFSAT